MVNVKLKWAVCQLYSGGTCKIADEGRKTTIAAGSAPNQALNEMK